MALLILLILLPIQAHAAPVVAVLSTTILEIGTFTITVGQVLMTVATMVYGAAQQRRAERQAQEAEQARKNAYNASLQDRLLTSVSSENPHVYVYGRARVGGTIVAIFTSGNKDQYKHIVCVHAAHECDAIEEVYIAGKPLGLPPGGGFSTTAFLQTTTQYGQYDGAPGTTVTLPHTPTNVLSAAILDAGGQPSLGQSAEFQWLGGTSVSISALPPLSTDPGYVETRQVRISYIYEITTSRVLAYPHLGTPTEPVDGYLNGELPALWPSTAVLRGYCYTVIRLDLNEQEFQGGIPPIEVMLRGKKLYDPRTATTYWSQNPALVAYDYLTSEICGVPASDLPVADYITAANVCDEAQSFGARYTFNGTVTAGQLQQQVLEKMAQSMAGGIIATTWSIYAGKYVAPVLALSQEDIIGKLAVTPGISDADLFNGVKGQYISSETGYTATDFSPYQNATYAAADGRDLWTNIDFPFTDGLQRVHNLARIFTEDQRNGYTVKADFSLKAWALQIGQRVTLTSAFLGVTGKVFRVMDKSYSPNAPVELTLKEDDASIWDFADAVVVDSTPNTNLQDPFSAVSAITGLAAYSGTDELFMLADSTILSRIRLVWDEVTTQSVYNNGTIEIEYKRVVDADWNKITVAGSQTQTWLQPVDDLSVYNIRIRASDPYLNIKSDWTYTTHTVLGKSEPPDDVTSFAIDPAGTATWSTVAGADIAGYIIRWQPGNNRSWGDANPIHEGILTTNPYSITIRNGITTTYMIKAVDTTGNESANVAAVIINLGDPLVENVIVSTDYKALGWPGTITGASISAGNIVATADASPLAWDANPGTAGWTLDTDPGWTSATYSSVTYLPDIFIVAAADAGAQLTLLSTIVCTSSLIEWRRDGDALGWTSDSEPGWTSDTDLAWTIESWRTWPGSVVAAEGRYEWRVSIQSRDIQGVISELTAQLDVADQVEVVGQVSILAAGTIIPTTKTWRYIKNINLSLLADGGTARSIRIEDRPTRLVTTRDGSNAAVNGTVLATLQGY